MHILGTARAAAIAAVACLSATSVAGAAPASTPPPLPIPAAPDSTAAERPATPETLALAAQLAPVYVEGIEVSLSPALINELGRQRLDALGERAPEYRRIIEESFREGFEACKPEIERIVIHAFATRFSVGELRAGAKFIETPSGRNAIEAMGRSAGGAPAAEPGVAAALIHLESTSDGRGFLHGVGVNLKSYEREMVAAVVPPILSRLADKIEISETRRAAAASAGPGAPTAESVALGVSISHDLYGLIDDKLWSKLDAIAVSSMTRSMEASTAFRPKWAAIVGSTLIEALRQERPAVEQAAGRALAKLYTRDELDAISELGRSPAPAYFVTVGLAKAQGQTPAPPSPEVKASLEKFQASGWSRTIFLKLQDKAELRKIGVEVLIALAPGWLRRIGEQTAADEAAVEAARGW